MRCESRKQNDPKCSRFQWVDMRCQIILSCACALEVACVGSEQTTTTTPTSPSSSSSKLSSLAVLECCMRVFTVHPHTDTLTQNSPRYHRERTVSILRRAEKKKRAEEEEEEDIEKCVPTQGDNQISVFHVHFYVVNMCARTVNDSAHSVISLCVMKIRESLDMFSFFFVLFLAHHFDGVCTACLTALPNTHTLHAHDVFLYGLVKGCSRVQRSCPLSAHMDRTGDINEACETALTFTGAQLFATLHVLTHQYKCKRCDEDSKRVPMFAFANTLTHTHTRSHFVARCHIE